MEMVKYFLIVVKPPHLPVFAMMTLRLSTTVTSRLKKNNCVASQTNISDDVVSQVVYINRCINC